MLRIHARGEHIRLACKLCSWKREAPTSNEVKWGGSSQQCIFIAACKSLSISIVVRISPTRIISTNHFAKKKEMGIPISPHAMLTKIKRGATSIYNN